MKTGAVWMIQSSCYSVNHPDPAGKHIVKPKALRCPSAYGTHGKFNRTSTWHSRHWAVFFSVTQNLSSNPEETKCRNQYGSCVYPIWMWLFNNVMCLWRSFTCYNNSRISLCVALRRVPPCLSPLVSVGSVAGSERLVTGNRHCYTMNQWVEQHLLLRKLNNVIPFCLRTGQKQHQHEKKTWNQTRVKCWKLAPKSILQTLIPLLVLNTSVSY